MRRALLITASAALASAIPVLAGETVRLSKEKFIDKCKGAWAGQMIGVCYAAPYEFKSNGKPLTDPLQAWAPERLKGAINQDDIYVEMTWLAALEKHGLDITFEQAGKAFADSQYALWHANRSGRDNLRRGISAPKSGHPDYNRHADDIDFQIEADLIGIICPGLPQESNRLCDIFGHLMNYGDGVYGGMFVGGMYSAAYFEEKDVLKVVQAGLACIPEKSTYHQCISDVIKWHNEAPGDWLATWKKLEAKWQDDVDCMPGNAFNIDAKLNGAYIVVGLLFGGGDMMKTMEISTRCGQDADCNCSSAAGVLACMKGYRALGDGLTGGIKKIAETNFSYTQYSWRTLIPACQRIVEKIIVRAGGQVDGDSYVIPMQEPKPAKLEQWDPAEKKKAINASPVKDADLIKWSPLGWRVESCGQDMDPGVRGEELGRKNVLVLHPVAKDKPAVLELRYAVPKDKPQLVFEVASDPHGDFLLKISAHDVVLVEKVIDTKGQWTTVTADLSNRAGKKATVRLENHANGWSNEAAYLGKIEIK